MSYSSMHNPDGSPISQIDRFYKRSDLEESKAKTQYDVEQVSVLAGSIEIQLSLGNWELARRLLETAITTLQSPPEVQTELITERYLEVVFDDYDRSRPGEKAFAIRFANALEREGIYTVGDLFRRNYEDISQIPTWDRERAGMCRERCTLLD